MAERIQKLISASGLLSRRAAEEAIAAGRVTVNGRTASLGDKAEPEEIRLDGKALPAPGRRLVVMLNKPRGYVTTLRDEKGRRDVSMLLRGLGMRLYPVGRLDMDSEGLLLLTNDGDFANRVMHPSHETDKTYLVWVTGEGLPEQAEKLSEPMELDGYRLRPAQVELLRHTEKDALLSLTIHEGRNRQIRRMCESCGLKVTRLRRVAEGGLRLGDLRPGSWRVLSEEEIKLVLPEG